MKMLLKDLMLMPVLFKAWRNGQVWLEPSHSELSVCMLQNPQRLCEPKRLIHA